MGESFALVGEQKDDVASLGLRLAQFEPQADAVDGVFVLTPFQRVARTAKAEPPFWRRTFDSCDLEIVTPSRLAISSARRARVQLGRSATGADKSGPATRSAACALSGSGPGARRALRASTPPLMKSLRHSRTVSWRTPKASAIRPLVQPASVNKIARARSASARSAPLARASAPPSHRPSPSPEICPPCSVLQSNQRTESRPTTVGQSNQTCLDATSGGFDTPSSPGLRFPAALLPFFWGLSRQIGGNATRGLCGGKKTT